MKGGEGREGRDEKKRRGGKGRDLHTPKLLQLLPATDNSQSGFTVGSLVAFEAGHAGGPPDPADLPSHKWDTSWRKPRALRIWMAVGTHPGLHLVTCELPSLSLFLGQEEAQGTGNANT